MERNPQQLATVNVNEAAKRRATGYRDFEERRKLGLGQFVSRDEIEAHNTSRSSDLVVTKRGVHLVRFCPDVQLIDSPPASDGELALAHSPSYVHDAAQGLLSAAAMREIGFPWSPAMAERARRSVGATMAAAARPSRTAWPPTSPAARTMRMRTGAAVSVSSTTPPWPPA